MSSGSPIGEFVCTTSVDTASVISSPKTPTAMNCGNWIHQGCLWWPLKVQ